jgi:hypothetical protein
LILFEVEVRGENHKIIVRQGMELICNLTEGFFVGWRKWSYARFATAAARWRGSVKDLQRQCVKDVMELNSEGPGAPFICGCLDMGHPAQGLFGE